DRSHTVREASALRTRIVHAAGGHGGQVELGGEFGERVIVHAVERHPVVEQLHVHRVRTEQVDKSTELACRRSLPTLDQRAAHAALATSGQDHTAATNAGGHGFH